MPGTPTPIFLLSFLGGTAASWAPVIARLPAALHPVPIDLPGFGDHTQTPGHTVAEMADHVAAQIRARAPTRFYIAGHSMGAKVATAVARRAEDGDKTLAGLAGLILLAASPPSPEPMDETRRQDMLTWFQGPDPERRAQAAHFIDANTARLLPEAIRTQLIDDVLRTNRTAWTAWLDHGSREDWRLQVATLQTPTLILSGSEDADLGPKAQRTHTAPHFAHVRSETIPGARHLLPSEAPAEVATHIAAFTRTAPAIPEAYQSLIDGPRTTTRLRTALHTRAQPDDPFYEPRALDPAALTTLRAVVAQILPGTPIDFAARLDTALAEGQGDGWRQADLPPDLQAMQAALATLDHLAQGFADQNAQTQHALLEQAAAGTAAPSLAGRAMNAVTGHPLLNAAQLKNWFLDLTATLARHYTAHPATLASMGYSGIAIGGDTDPQGFHQIEHPEPWEPAPTAHHPTGAHP